ncbi:hypothetical protein B194_2882 [Serratia plymuthica A30]|nr:hypothetical protein B194_2882 [Serratia plymuthica A30]
MPQKYGRVRLIHGVNKTFHLTPQNPTLYLIKSVTQPN